MSTDKNILNKLDDYADKASKALHTNKKKHKKSKKAHKPSKPKVNTKKCSSIVGDLHRFNIKYKFIPALVLSLFYVFSSIDILPEMFIKSLLGYVDDVLVIISLCVYFIVYRKDVGDNGGEVEIACGKQDIYSSIIRSNYDSNNNSNSRIARDIADPASSGNSSNESSDSINDTDSGSSTGREATESTGTKTESNTESNKEDTKKDTSDLESSKQERPRPGSSSSSGTVNNSSASSSSETESVYNSRGVYRDEDELFAERQRKCRPEGLIIEEGTPIW
jgi:uncharacterized membrane protein YkvA (DUF1232 family)